MLYREAGQYKTSYEADQAVFPVLQDRIGIAIILFIAIVVVPLTMSSFTISSVMIPVLIFALAAIGLNILTGYTGLISLGVLAVGLVMLTGAATLNVLRWRSAARR